MKVLMCALFVLKIATFANCEQKNFLCEYRMCVLRDIESTASLLKLLDNLTQLPTETYGDKNEIKELSYFNQISCENVTMKKFPQKLLQSFFYLQTFSAENVNLQSIERFDFKFAGKFSTLNLGHNKISSLGEKVFEVLQNLENLDLSNNEIVEIHENAFVGVSKKLHNIDLSFNKLKEVSEDLIIGLSESSIFLRKVSFENNEISEILKSNKVHEKPWSIGHLSFKHNNLKVFELNNFNAESLNLENNKIESLQINESIYGLGVDNNKLKFLQVGTEVVRLSAENNQIVDLNLHNSSAFRSVNLSGNKIGEKALVELRNSKNLQELQLSETSLTILKFDSFAEFEDLQILRIDKNRISSIQYGVFSHQRSLTLLNISSNVISHIDFYVFTSLSWLQLLDISRNTISAIEHSENIRKILPSLRLIDVSNNLWDCSYLSRLHSTLQSQYIEIAKPLRFVKNSSNIAGVKCIGDKNHKHQSNESNVPDDLNLKLEELNNQIKSMKSQIENFEEKFTKLEAKFGENSNATNLKIDQQKLANEKSIHNVEKKIFEVSKQEKVDKTSGFSWTIFTLTCLLLAAVGIIGFGVKVYIVPNFRRIQAATASTLQRGSEMNSTSSPIVDSNI